MPQVPLFSAPTDEELIHESAIAAESTDISDLTVVERDLAKSDTDASFEGSASASHPQIASHRRSRSPSASSNHSQSKRVSKFYERQNNLLEKYEDDSRLAQKSLKQRPASMSVKSEVIDEVQSTTEEHEGHALIPDGSAEDDLAPTPCSVRQPTSPRITFIDRDHSADDSEDKQNNNSARRLALLTLIVNVMLMLFKAVATYLSGSLSILSSVVDSAVDITSGLVIWLTARAIKRRDPYDYPRGRTRLEPLALIIVSVVMAVASLQILLQAVSSIIEGSIDPKVDLTTVIIMVSTVVIKMTLFIACKFQHKNHSVDVLAQDHRNDCVSNTVALLCAFGAHHLWVYLDPIGAILVSIYIAVTWYQTGKEQLNILSGRSAEPDFINRIIKICIDHDQEIQYIDTVYVYHFGHHFLVEVHIVLDPEMPLRHAHDISESLQIKIETLPEVERAFVHCDYEYDHHPDTEHKIV